VRKDGCASGVSVSAVLVDPWGVFPSANSKRHGGDR
jgi:hypothetical protein